MKAPISGAYQLQAAVAAVHDEAARAEDTDWPQIPALYGELERLSDNPMVALSRAVAAAMAHGPGVGLEQIEALEAVRGHRFEKAGDHERAPVHYRAAAERTTSLPERDYLNTRYARLAAAAAAR